VCVCVCVCSEWSLAGAARDAQLVEMFCVRHFSEEQRVRDAFKVPLK